MSGTFLTTGAIAGFLIAVILIFLKLPPWLSLTAGALMGGLLGGGTLAEA